MPGGGTEVLALWPGAAGAGGGGGGGAAGAGGDRTLVVGRKDGTDPRSAASNTAVNLLLFLLNFLYDRVGWHVNCEGVSWLCSIIIKY